MFFSFFLFFLIKHFFLRLFCLNPIKSSWRETRLGNTLLLLKDYWLELISTSKSTSCLHEETSHHCTLWRDQNVFGRTTAPLTRSPVLLDGMRQTFVLLLMNIPVSWHITPTSMKLSESLKQYYFDWKRKKPQNSMNECIRKLTSVRGGFKSCAWYIGNGWWQLPVFQDLQLVLWGALQIS